MSAVLNQTDPVEILLNLAKTGEVDPWDVDIVEATDRFLNEMERLEAHAIARSARCLFYAAALVNLKAKVLSEGASATALVDEINDWDDFGDELLGDEALPRLELPLFRVKPGLALTPRDRCPRGRSLTMQDLLEALRRLDERAMEAPEDHDDPWDLALDFDEDIGDVPSAHEDDLEGDILCIREHLKACFAKDRKRIRLEDASLEGMGRSMAYRALLFLGNDDELELEQEEIYGDLYVSPGPKPLRELSAEEKTRRAQRESRRQTMRDKRAKQAEKQSGSDAKRREIPRPTRGRKLARRPGLAPPAHSRRPRARRIKNRGASPNATAPSPHGPGSGLSEPKPDH